MFYYLLLKYKEQRTGDRIQKTEDREQKSEKKGVIPI